MKTSYEVKTDTLGAPVSLRQSKCSMAAPGATLRTARLMLALAAAHCASVAASHGQTWETAYDMPTMGHANGATSDAAGNIFVVGLMRDEFASPSYAVVMKSSDGGQSWDNDPSTPDFDDPSDAFSVDGLRPIYSNIKSARVADGAGAFTDHLVAVGSGSRPVTNQLGPFNSNTFIRRSLDSGATWQTIDEYEHPTYENFSGGRIAIDSNGNIYTVTRALEHIVTTKGKNSTTTRIDHWLIRKGTNHADGTLTWQTMDLPFPSTSQSIYGSVVPNEIACVGNDVYVVGGGGADGTDWKVIKSGDGGATWASGDNYRLDASGPSHANAIAGDSMGNIYVVGTGSQTVTSGKGKAATQTTTQYWIVRKAAPGGTAWQTVDAFVFPGGYGTPNDVAVDAFDRVHVNGSGRINSPLSVQWVTRQGSGGTWTTTDTFTYAEDGGTTHGSAICADPFGNVFAAGRSSDPSSEGGNARAWIVRRKLAP